MQSLAQGAVTSETMQLTGACILPVILALVLGEILHRRIKQELQFPVNRHIHRQKARQPADEV